jgi:hypothetical protein
VGMAGAVRLSRDAYLSRKVRGEDGHPADDSGIIIIRCGGGLVILLVSKAEISKSTQCSSNWDFQPYPKRASIDGFMTGLS